MTTEPPSMRLADHDTARARRLFILEFGSRADFENPKLAYRRIFAEMLGTFMLVLVAAGGGILHAKGQISLTAAVVAPGLMVMAIILFMGAVSGAHLNPVVSLAFAMRRDFPWDRFFNYVLSQLIGAALACLLLLAIFGNVAHLGATLPGPGYHGWQALLIEVVLTTTLVSVILGTASAAERRHDRRPGRRWLHRARRAVGSTGQRRLDEPRALVRSGAGQRRLEQLLGIRGWSERRSAARRRLRGDPPGPGRRSDITGRRIRNAQVDK